MDFHVLVTIIQKVKFDRRLLTAVDLIRFESADKETYLST